MPDKLGDCRALKNFWVKGNKITGQLPAGVAVLPELWRPGRVVTVAVDDHRGGEQVIHRDVEEALDLPGVQVDPEHPACPRHRNEIGDQPRRTCSRPASR